ncbi:GSCOCG00007096001-RA-CDS [Cotesia congregata]|nr:GSCOCG00007096001-RA-CDS [Cotesia congregata]
MSLQTTANLVLYFPLNNAIADGDGVDVHADGDDYYYYYCHYGEDDENYNNHLCHWTMMLNKLMIFVFHL